MSKRLLGVLLVMILVPACSDSPSEPCPDCPPPVLGLIVSNPVPGTTFASNGAMAQSNSGDNTVAYVGMTSGTVPSGVLVRVRRGNSVSLLTTMRDGGFRPLAIPAQIGDSIEVSVLDAGNQTVFHALVAVAALRAPVVVRTEPPPKKRDHPLNAAIVVVFSKPVDSATATPTTIQLLRGTNAIAGHVRFLDPTLDATHVSVAFTPDAPLAAGTDYRLLATTQVHDVDGRALAAADTLVFTTGQAALGPPASLHTSPDSTLDLLTGETFQLTATVRDSAGNIITDHPVTWSLATFGMQDGLTVSQTGLVTAISDGTYAVRASVGALEDYVFVFVMPHPAASVTLTPTSATVSAYDSIYLSATVRDSAGRVTRYPGWPYSTSGVIWTSNTPGVTVLGHDVDFNQPGFVAATVTGVTPGSATITATSGPAHATAAITVTATPVTVSVTPDSARLIVSGYAMVFDTLRRSDGQIVSGFPVSWRSDNPGVATVDTNGLVKGIRLGSARIIATRDVSTDTALITVGTINLVSVSSTCAVSATGAAYCWGLNTGNELGMGSNQGPLIEATLGDNQCGVYATWYSCSTVPVLVAGGLNVSAVVGGNLRCALTTGGAAYCWAHFQLDDSGNGVAHPVAVGGGHSFASLSGGYNHVCAVTSGGAAYCWGDNYQGQLGDGTTTSTLVPVAVTRGLGFASVSSGLNAFTCGLTVSGAAYCWGGNNEGQLGDGSTTEHHAPVAVGGGLTFASVSAGGDHACGITTSGAAYCWGANYFGQLGDSSTTGRHTPVAVAGGLSFASISAGGSRTCGVTTSGPAYCWGGNDVGQLGDGSTIDRHVPVAVSGGLTFSSVSARDATCGVTTGRVTYCWGSNVAGMLGNGTLTNSPVPVKVAGQP
jgi:alpha-tubulin suppressor-like RCC1 family protein